MFDKATKSILIEGLNKRIRLIEDPSGGTAPPPYTPPNPNAIRGVTGGNVAPPSYSTFNNPNTLSGGATGASGPLPYSGNAGVGLKAPVNIPGGMGPGKPVDVSGTVTGALTGAEQAEAGALAAGSLLGGAPLAALGKKFGISPSGFGNIGGPIGSFAAGLMGGPYGQQFTKNLAALGGGERAANILTDMPRRSANILVQNLGYTPEGSWAEQGQYEKPKTMDAMSKGKEQLEKKKYCEDYAAQFPGKKGPGCP